MTMSVPIAHNNVALARMSAAVPHPRRFGATWDGTSLCGIAGQEGDAGQGDVGEGPPPTFTADAVGMLGPLSPVTGGGGLSISRVDWRGAATVLRQYGQATSLPPHSSSVSMGC